MFDRQIQLILMQKAHVEFHAWNGSYAYVYEICWLCKIPSHQHLFNKAHCNITQSHIHQNRG